MTASARRGGLLAALLLGAAGIAFFFRIELASGFAAVKGSHVDARQVHWLVEWVSRCLHRDPLCADPWSAPFFHPAADTMTYGDPVLGLGLVYAGSRALGTRPAEAFVLTQILMIGLTFGAALWMLAGPLRQPPLPAALGAYLFALGAPIEAQVDHPHLFSRFPLPILFAALLCLLEEREPRRRRVWWALAASAWALQAWFNLNLFWLASYVAVWLAAAALLLSGTRRVLAGAARTDLLPALVSAVFAGAAVLPLLQRMVAARRLVGGAHDVSQWIDFTPQPESWLNLGAHNWLWGSLAAWPPIRDLRFPWEHELGIGLVSTGVCVAGVWLGRRRPALQALFLGSALAGLLALRWPGGFTPWTLVHAVWPGAESLRAVGRISLVLLVPAAIALATALARLQETKGRIAVAAVAAIILLEQQRSFDTTPLAPTEARVVSLAALVPADCDSFFWSPRTWGMDLAPEVTQVDAMWAALALDKPTVNGYSSYAPPGWYDLHGHGVGSPADRARLRDYLSYWALQSGARPGEICWILSRQGPDGLEPAGFERIDPARSPWPATERVASGAPR